VPVNLLRIPLALAFCLCVAGAAAAAPGGKDEPPVYHITPGNSYNPVGYGRPTVLLLHYPGAIASDQQHGVRMLKGKVILDQPMPAQEQWDILPGTTLRPDQRPPRGLQVQLFTSTGANRQLLCTIDVRYYRTRQGGWRPWYALDSEKNGIWYHGKFKSFNPAYENTPLLYNDTSSLPNGQGYYLSLKLKSSAGPVGIKSWVVGIHQP
jgi:hypothetical protein